MYQAGTMLYLVSPNRNDASAVVGDQQVAKAFALIPQSGSVLRATLQAVGDRSLTLSQLSSMVTVNNDRDTQYVIINVRDSNPERAARLANEITRQSVIRFEAAASDSGQTKQFVQQELDRLEIEIGNLEKDLATLQGQAQRSTSSPSQPSLINQLGTRLQEDRTLYNQLLGSYTNMSDTQAVILQEAEAPSGPVQNPVFAVGIGMVVGLIAIVGVIVLIEQTDDIVRTPAKVSQVTRLPTLMTIARLPAIAQQAPQLNGYDEIAGNADTIVTRKLVPAQQAPQLNGYDEIAGNADTVKVDKVKLVSAKQAHLPEEHREGLGVPDAANRLPAIAEQAPSAGVGTKAKDQAVNRFSLPEVFVTLGVLLHSKGVQSASNGGTPGSLLITSPENGEGKTLVASHLALGLARCGVEVILIDANLRKPEVHEIFGVSNRVGLSSLLTLSRTVESTGQMDKTILAALQKTHEPNLTILPGGPAIDMPSELLSSPRMTALLNLLSKKAFVVIDSPAVLTSSESMLLANKSDGILMVADARHTAAARLNQALELLSGVNINILGVVLNRASNQR